MATLTPAARAHRRDLNVLVGIAQRDLGLLFREFSSADAARDGLRDVLPRLVAIYGEAAASLAADWYDDLRDASGARGRFTAIPADLPDVGRTDALAGWAVSPLYAAEPDFATSLAKVSGGLQRIIANGARYTVQVSSLEDPAAGGWVRVGAGACKSGWCDQFLDGEVRTVAYDFPAHDNCNCHAEPAF